jgi:peptidoglycan hydrolase-like protein with peptidoglycan-binding domain
MASGLPALQQGSTGRDVLALQRALNRRTGEVKLAVDGACGPLTVAQVRAFQKSRGIVVDGKVGVKTWGQLRKAGYTLPAGKLDRDDAIRAAVAIRNNAAAWATALGDAELLAWCAECDERLKAALGNYQAGMGAAVVLAVPVVAAEAVAVAGAAVSAAMLLWCAWTAATGAPAIKAAADRAPNKTGTWQGTAQTGKGPWKVKLGGNPRGNLTSLWRLAVRLGAWLSAGVGIIVAAAELATATSGAIIAIIAAIVAVFAFVKRKGRG